MDVLYCQSVCRILPTSKWRLLPSRRRRIRKRGAVSVDKLVDPVGRSVVRKLPSHCKTVVPGHRTLNSRELANSMRRLDGDTTAQRPLWERPVTSHFPLQEGEETTPRYGPRCRGYGRQLRRCHCTVFENENGPPQGRAVEFRGTKPGFLRTKQPTPRTNQPAPLNRRRSTNAATATWNLLVIRWQESKI